MPDLETAPGRPTAEVKDVRWRRMGTGASLLIAGRLTSMVCGLIQAPLIVAQLGPEGFGVWIALTGLLWTLALIDWGTGFAVQNRVGNYLAAGRESDAATIVRFATRRVMRGAVLVVGAGALLNGFDRWPGWFSINDPGLQTQTRLAMGIVIGVAAVVAPLSLASRVAAAVQQTGLTGIWTALGSLVSLAAVLVAGSLNLPLAGFVSASCLMPLVLHAGTWLHLRSRLQWLRGRTSTSELPAPGLWRESFLFWIPQVGAAAIGTFLPILVILFAGPTVAAAFGALQRLFAFALQLQTIVLTPTWPAYTHSAAVGDVAFLRRTLRTTWLVTSIAFVLPLLLLTPTVPSLVRLWLGPAILPITQELLWLMAVWHVLQLFGQPIATFLNAVGRVGSVAASGWLGIGGTVGICFVAGPRWGAEGVVLALAVPYGLVSLPLTAWHARRALISLVAQASKRGNAQSDHGQTQIHG